MTHRIARLVIVCGVIVLLGRSSNAEEMVLVPPGTYNLSEILTRAGTAANWIRYKPQQPGTVTIRGGGGLVPQQVHKSFVILDGFLFDGNLHPQAPTKTGALGVVASNVRIENSELRGPKDIHSGYDANDQLNCKESRDFPNGGAGVGVDGQNVVFDNVVIHGFYSAGTFRKGSTVRVQNSLIRNNFNGLMLQGTFVEIRDSVLWVHPNHLNTMSTPGGSVHLINNLIVDAQETNGINCEDCVNELVFIHNTIYIPANKPCYGMAGIKTGMAKGPVTVRDNIVVSNDDPWIGSSPETISMTSDYNMFFHHKKSATDDFRHGPRTANKETKQVTRAQWLALGRDSHSIFDTLPGFANPPQYEDFAANRWGFRVPTTAAEARSWFFLRDDSPGTGAASDRRNIGISPTSVLPASPLPSGPRAAPATPTQLHVVR